MPSLTIELFGDLVCPWCYLGAHRLERVLAELDVADRIDVVHRPFLLRPSTPPGGLDVHAELRKRYGDLDPLFARLVAEAESSGLALDPRRQPFAYPTLAAHTLLRAAEARGTQRALAVALYRAHFDEGRNISDPDVLASIAEHHGFVAAEVVELVTDPAELARTQAETRQASAAGITAVPVFVIGTQTLAGAQPESVLRAAITAALPG